ncbi:hypothetical protein GCM10027048_22220 [Hymenobacter coalescens]
MDKQLVGLSGEYFVAAELLKRNFQVAVTLGNAKSVDLFIRNEASGQTCGVSVKTLRQKPNCFTLHSDKLEPDTVYFFLYLNPVGHGPDYFILRGADILADLPRFYGASYGRADRRETINHGPLQPYHNNWGVLP